MPATRAPRTCFSEPISAHRRLAVGSLPLDMLKAIKNELGVTVNDVVVALCASMLRAWFQERRELPDDPLVAMIPVSVRTEDEMGAFGKRVSAMFVPIPTDEPDPRRRIERTHEVLRAAKERHSATPVSTIVDGVGLNITVISYRNHVDVGIIGDRDQLEDAWTMLDGLRAALQEFHALLGADAARGGPRGRARVALRRRKPIPPAFVIRFRYGNCDRG